MTKTANISNAQVELNLVDASTRAANAAKTSSANRSATTVHPDQAISPKADQAVLSNIGSLLANSGSNDVRSERVASIQAAIQNGSYNVPAHAVAEKLIDSMLR